MLVRQVEEGILQQLKSGQYAPGEKLPSLRELSREFGCSYVIAFRAVQALKNSGYLETAKGNGIFVTGDARSRMEKKLIVYISDRQESSQLNPHDLLRYSCFQRLVREAGFVDLALNEEESLSTDQMNQLAGALITLRTPMQNELIARKIPCVFISSLGNHNGMPSVIPDFYQGSCDVMRHLLRCGYRRIGAVTIDVNEFNQASFAPRLQAYYDTMKAAGLPTLPPLLWNIKNPQTKNHLWELMSSAQRPDALFIPNDLLAVEVIRELSKKGVEVPADIGVAGLENQEFFYGSTVPLTTASFDNRALVQEACALLLNMICHPGTHPAVVKVPMTLIVRESTKRLPHQPRKPFQISRQSIQKMPFPDTI